MSGRPGGTASHPELRAWHVAIFATIPGPPPILNLDPPTPIPEPEPEPIPIPQPPEEPPMLDLRRVPEDFSRRLLDHLKAELARRGLDGPSNQYVGQPILHLDDIMTFVLSDRGFVGHLQQWAGVNQATEDAMKAWITHVVDAWPEYYP